MEIKEQKLHKHGFVRLIDVMGDDNSIADAARVSYGKVHGLHPTIEV